MEKDSYPVNKIVWNIISIILLIGFIIILFYIFYKPYYKFSINDNFIGYYKDYSDFENLYNSIEKKYEEDGVKVTKYLPNNPLTEKTYVKESFVEKFDNKKLIEEQLKKDYTIYQILVNNEAQFYTKTKEEADTLVSELKNEVKESTNIKVEPLIVQDLSLLNTKEEIEETKKTTIEKNKKVTSRSSTSRRTNPTYIWPTISKTITSKFGGRSSGYHTGLDIAVNSNSPVYTVKEGTVLMSCWNGNYGYQVKIKHSNGVITTYAHNSKLLVKKGQNVVQGQIIARSGSTGNSTGPHLHIEFIINGQFVNPQKYI